MSKHSGIDIHFVCDHIQQNHISLIHIRARFQLVDVFTKPIFDPSFTSICNKLMVLEKPIISLREMLNKLPKLVIIHSLVIILNLSLSLYFTFLYQFEFTSQYMNFYSFLPLYLPLILSPINKSKSTIQISSYSSIIYFPLI